MTKRQPRAREIFFCLLVTSGLLLSPSLARAQAVSGRGLAIGAPSANAAFTGQDTVTISSVIRDATVIGGSVQLQRLDADGRVAAVVGVMHDDGRDGDLIAGDNIWTLRTPIESNTAGQMAFRVSAAVKSSIRRAISAPALIDIKSSQTRPLSSHNLLSGKPRVALPRVSDGTTLLDYEAFPDATVLTNQYSGVTFTNAIVFASGISLNEFEYPPHSGTNVVSDNNGAMTINFTVPVASFSGFFTYSVPLTITAYDSSNTVVGTVNSHFTNNQGLSGAAGTSPNDSVVVAAAGGIAKITITGAPQGASFTMDDTVLGAPVGAPPPPCCSGGPPPVVTGPPALSIGALNLGTIGAGGVISGALAASGGTPPYKFASLGPLPDGVTLTSDGKIGGKPTQAGAASFTATVTDSAGVTAGAVVSFSVLAITTATLPDATAFADYAATIAATGGTSPYQFSATGLPPGASISGTGALRGPITKQGTYTISVQVSDGNGVTAKATLSLKVNAPGPLSVTGATLPGGVLSARYSQALIATGGAPPYSWVLTGGALPAGLTLASTGVVSGFPGATGIFTFNAAATDSTGGTAAAQFSIAITPPPVVIHAPPVLSSGMVGVEYPVQLVTASGGVAPYTFAVSSGSLPAGLTLSSDGSVRGTPTAAVSAASFTVKATDSAGLAGTATLQVTIRVKTIDLALSAGSLAFSLASGSGAVPPSQSIQVRSTSAGVVIPYSASLTPAVSWLTVSGGTSTPGVLNVALTSQALTLAAAATPYQATIVFACAASAPCAGAPQSVGVSLTVTTLPAQLSILNTSLSFTGSIAAPQPSSQSLNLQNTGGGSAGIVSIASNAGWLQVGAFPAVIPAGPVTSIGITADPTGLAAGFYRSTITVVSSSGTNIVAATLLVGSGASMALAPAGVQVLMAAGGTPPPVDNSIPVAVSGSGPVAWTASVLPGASWLSVPTATGTSTSDTPAAATYSIDPAAAGALAPGTWFGTIQFSSGAVLNSPQDFQVVLTVTTGIGAAVAIPSPQGLLFIGAGTLPPQTIQVSSVGASSVTYQASASTTDGHSWLTVSPSTGTATASAPARTLVAVSTAGLTAGTYYGAVNFAGSGAAVESVSVTLIVPSASSGSAASNQAFTAAATAGCAPSQIAVARMAPVNGFSFAAGLPAPLSVRLADNCGNPIVNGSVVASFSNGDSPLALQLANAATGLYSATWTPRQTASQATVSAAVTAPGLTASSTEFKGTVTPGATPVLNPLATLHVFYPQVGGALAPGTIVQIYGSNFASQIAPATTIPLPMSLAGTSVIIGGEQAPLYYVSPGQINAQVPFELASNHQYQVVINSGGVLSTPDTIQTVAEAPGFAALEGGSIIAIHSDGSLVTAASPARPSEYIVIFGAGLGATDNAVATGAGTPDSPLSNALSAPSLTINSESVPVLFAGLTPSLVGLYQINFQVPADAPNGSLPLQVTQNGAAANAAVLIVHN